MRLLLLSNSTNAGQTYLQHALPHIQPFLQTTEESEALFIPYAGVTITPDEYTSRVREKFESMNIRLISVHQTNDPVKAVMNAHVIVVGGGNTFQLINMLQKNFLLEPIKERILKGIPYIGWSAGANSACPTICTTNDMPIVQPASFDALNLIPFQINPHYLDKNPDGHAGETREMRILEFLELNPDISVIGLREGSLLLYEEHKLSLIGNKPVRIFQKGKMPFELSPGDNMQFLLHSGN
ncbi:MAG: dipeptidase PepE [Bacteroidales bacterium]|nr:dipeptidase PepE [Bacteroidales bacterium]MBN2764324.1 dipeptidase PepE [Bacteroidales bacterium]